MQSIQMTNEDINIFSNKKIVDEVIPQTYEVLMSWVCTKDPNVSFLIYMQQLNIPQEKHGKWIRENKKKLEQCNSSEFDVTFLHSLLPILSQGKILTPKDAGYSVTLDNSNSIESILKTVKNLRNELTHDIPATKLDNSSFVESVLKLLLEVTGHKFLVPQKDIDESKRKVTYMIRKIRHKTYTREEKVEKINEVLKNTKTQLTNYLNHTKSVGLPTRCKLEFDRRSIFHPISLSYSKNERLCDTDIESETLQKVTIQCDEIIEKVQSNIKVICGGPGAGKTFLIKSIVEAALGITGTTSTHDFILLLECEKIHRPPLCQHIRIEFPDLQEFEDEEIIAGIKNRRTLFAFDGYDEGTKQTVDLVWEAIEMSYGHPNIDCVITVRPHAGQSLSQALARRGIKHEVLSIDELNELSGQREFLNRLDKDPKLVKSFSNLPEKARNIFVTPIYLSLFYVFYKENPSQVREWKNELSVYEALHRLLEENVREKLRRCDIPNLEYVCTNMVDIICSVSLDLFIAGKNIISEEDYASLKQKCRTEFGTKISWQEVLSCFFTMDYNINQWNERCYRFFHSSLQEFMAAKSIINRWKDNSWRQMLSKTFNAIRTLYSSDKCLGGLIEIQEVGRCGNFIKFIILELVKLEELHRYISILLIALKHYEPDFEYCVDLIASSGDDENVAKLLAEVLTETSSLDVWIISSRRYLNASAMMLPYVQPSVIKISTMDALPVMQLCKFFVAVQSHFVGDLWLWLTHSYLNGEVMDECIIGLTKLRCKVCRMMVCLASDEALEIVRQIPWKDGASLYLSTAPERFNLHLLEGVNAFLWLRFKYQDIFDKCKSLPLDEKKRSPTLQLTDVPNDVSKVCRVIASLAPACKKYQMLHLLHCSWDHSDLTIAATRLCREGLRTLKMVEKSRFVCVTGNTKATTLRTGRYGGVCMGCKASHKANKITSSCWQLLITDRGGELSSKNQLFVPYKNKAKHAKSIVTRTSLKMTHSSNNHHGPFDADSIIIPKEEWVLTSKRAVPRLSNGITDYVDGETNGHDHAAAPEMNVHATSQKFRRSKKGSRNKNKICSRR